MATKRFDPAVRRRMYWDDELMAADCCPECGGALEPEYHVYLLLVPEGLETASFVSGQNGGRFCARCPVVVLDRGVFEAAATGAGVRRGRFTVSGIVDMGAIPEEQRSMALGEDDNPIPLVAFLPPDPGIERRTLGSGAPGRNDPCPCGSGRKYKKCCLH